MDVTREIRELEAASLDIARAIRSLKLAERSQTARPEEDVRGTFVALGWAMDSMLAAERRFEGARAGIGRIVNELPIPEEETVKNVWVRVVASLAKHRIRLTREIVSAARIALRRGRQS